MRSLGVLHDLALALLAGGVSGVGLSVGILFARAPSREIAGQIGNAIFGRLGPAALLLAVIVLGARVAMDRGARAAGAAPAKGAGGIPRGAGFWIDAGLALLAAPLALWITPQMSAIWAAGAHAADGTGLLGDDRSRFLALHGISNLLYLGILGLAAAGLALRAWRRGA